MIGRLETSLLGLNKLQIDAIYAEHEEKLGLITGLSVSNDLELHQLFRVCIEKGYINVKSLNNLVKLVVKNVAPEDQHSEFAISDLVGRYGILTVRRCVQIFLMYSVRDPIYFRLAFLRMLIDYTGLNWYKENEPRFNPQSR